MWVIDFLLFLHSANTFWLVGSCCKPFKLQLTRQIIQLSGDEIWLIKFIDFLPCLSLFPLLFLSSRFDRPTSSPRIFCCILSLAHLLLFLCSFDHLIFCYLSHGQSWIIAENELIFNARDNEYKEHHKKWFIVTDGSEQEETNKYTQSMTAAAVPTTKRSSGTIRFLILIVA